MSLVGLKTIATSEIIYLNTYTWVTLTIGCNMKKRYQLALVLVFVGRTFP